MTTYPPPFPNLTKWFDGVNLFWRPLSIKITFVEAKKGFPLRSGCGFQIQMTRVDKL